MKKYIFNLGAMLIGAWWMFLFTHTEVSAESEDNKTEAFECSRKYVGDYDIQHCETDYLDCAVTSSGVSCIRKG